MELDLTSPIIKRLPFSITSRAKVAIAKKVREARRVVGSGAVRRRRKILRRLAKEALMVAMVVDTGDEGEVEVMVDLAVAEVRTLEATLAGVDEEVSVAGEAHRRLPEFQLRRRHCCPTFDLALTSVGDAIF